MISLERRGVTLKDNVPLVQEQVHNGVFTWFDAFLCVQVFSKSWNRPECVCSLCLSCAMASVERYRNVSIFPPLCVRTPLVLLLNTRPWLAFPLNRIVTSEKLNSGLVWPASLLMCCVGVRVQGI